MVVLDLEIFKHDWMMVWLDTDTKKFYHIVNDKEKLHKFYDKYKSTLLVGYNIRNYDKYILQGILCGFDPYKISDWIINKELKGYQYSKLLNNYPVFLYDCSVVFKSLKQCEAFMGHDIRETSVPFDIDRKLTEQEIKETLKYCKHDVSETFEVFMETTNEYLSHVGLVKEFDLPFNAISKTKAQISAMILGAQKHIWDDEFDIQFPDTLRLGRYEWLKDYYDNWSNNSKDYGEMELKTTVGGIPHVYGIGGLHGSIDKYYGEGYYLMADVASFYPAIMIEYDFLSRNVRQPKKFTNIRDERVIMKRNKDKRQQPRKIVLNSTYGASKDQYNNLFDPRNANNVCIAGQLLLTDLIDKLEDHCQLIQSNTDGVLVKLFRKEDKDKIIGICNEWSKRTRMDLEFDEYVKVIQSNVNNYIILDADGNCKRKGAIVKKLSKLDYDLPIVNEAVVNYFTKGIPVEDTVLGCNELIKFQKIVKISSKYEYAFKEDFTESCVVLDSKTYRGHVLNEKVHRVFASLHNADGMLYKKSKSKTTLDKTPSTPEKCFIINDNVLNMPIPDRLDKSWYIDEAKKRIENFV